jgi:hypothetical protein
LGLNELAPVISALINFFAEKSQAVKKEKRHATNEILMNRMK